MEINLNLINVVILFGAIQGFMLCWVLYQKRKANPLGMHYFILFLFSLSFLNLFYALLDANVLEIYKPLYLFPFPYKYLIGASFYLFIKNSFINKNKITERGKALILFLPAIIYALLHLYWFSISIYENSYRITRVVIDSNFFRINEFFYLAYTIALVLMALQLLKRKQILLQDHPRKLKSITWLKLFSRAFLGMLIIDLILYATDLIIHNGQETLLFYYPNFILNSAFIYYIGYIGYVKPRLLSTGFSTEEANGARDKAAMIEKKLTELMNAQEVYRNKKITISQVALQLEIPEKELSAHINEVHQRNFSEYINLYRVNKVKELIKSTEGKKYTLVALGEQAGFSSKSSFNLAFKKLVGLTPSEYKRGQELNRH